MNKTNSAIKIHKFNMRENVSTHIIMLIGQNSIKKRSQAYDVRATHYTQNKKREKSSFIFPVSFLKSCKSGDQKLYLRNEKEHMAESEGLCVISLCYVCLY